MKMMPDKCTDIILTSPPYNMNLRILNGKYVSRCRNKNHAKEFATKYDDYSDDLSMDDYFKFQKEFISEALRISNLVFYNIQMITGNKIALFRLMGEFADKIKEVFIWDKIHGQPAMLNNVANSRYEFIIVFDANKPYNRTFDVCNFKRGTFDNVLQVKRERNKDCKAAFPMELVKIIIENFTNEGDIVMDPFMGTGTTGIVANSLGRSFIGVELSEKLFNIAKERLLDE
jgi:site-specific DNA-methyltransferase (adenine-specific)/modification methylase